MSDDLDTRGRTERGQNRADRTERGRTAADRPDATPRPPTGNQGPDELRELPKRSYPHVLRRVVKEFGNDNLTVWAAALTYYAVLSIFPGLLIIVSALRLFGPRTVTSVSHNLSGIAPGPVTSILQGAATSLQHGRAGTAGILAVASLVGALWTASGYIGVFMKASNEIYDVPEGRPIWKTLPLR